MTMTYLEEYAPAFVAELVELALAALSFDEAEALGLDGTLRS